MGLGFNWKMGDLFVARGVLWFRLPVALKTSDVELLLLSEGGGRASVTQCVFITSRSEAFGSARRFLKLDAQKTSRSWT